MDDEDLGMKKFEQVSLAFNWPSSKEFHSRFLYPSNAIIHRLASLHIHIYISLIVCLLIVLSPLRTITFSGQYISYYLNIV